MDLAVPENRPVEHDAPAVGGPRRMRVEARISGQAYRIAAVGIHDVNLHIAIAVAVERDALPVRGPFGMMVHRVVEGEAPWVAPVGVHHVNLQALAQSAAEGDPSSVGWP